DLEQLIADGAGQPIAPPAGESPIERVVCGNLPQVEELPLAPLVRGTGALDRDRIAALVARAALAPSGGNCQPWRFTARGESIECAHDADRSRSLLDFRHAASQVAFGAALENLVLAASELGRAVEVEPFPERTGARPAWRARLAGT